MALTAAVRQIMSWYDGAPAGTMSNLHRMLMHGRLGGTGKLVILPVDQGFEHGPTRSFAVNPAAYDPRYHARLALDAGCNGYAAPLGFIEAISSEFAGQIPLILKVNSADSLYHPDDPMPALTGSVDDAVRLGCAAVGITIYPGTTMRTPMYEQVRTLAAEAREAGLVLVVWAYPRGSALPGDAQTSVDVVGYAAHIACQLGAHIIKVKPPTHGIHDPKAAESAQRAGVQLATLADRVRHVVQCAFNGRRIVIFSGGPAKSTEDVLEENRQTAAGGGFGTIMGRNSFQRPHDEAVALLHQVMDIHHEAAVRGTAMLPVTTPSTVVPV